MHLTLSKKLYFFICVILVLNILPLFYIAEKALTRFGSYAHLVNKDQIYNMSNRYLSDITGEMAQTHNEIFKRIKTTSSLMANHLTDIYNSMDALSETTEKEPNVLRWNQKNQMFFSSKQEVMITAYWGNKNITDKIQNEINTLSYFKPTLIKSQKLIKESLATHVITATGIGYYYSPDINAKKACYNLPPASKFDLRDGEPVTIFTKEDKKLYDTQWTSIYKDDVIDGLMMTATTPIYDKKGQFRGITGIDIPVEHIIKNMTENSYLEKFTNMNNSFCFLQNKKGKLLAFPDQFFGLFGLNVNLKQFKNSSHIFNYSLEDSSIESIQKIPSMISSVHDGIINLMINDERYLLAVSNLSSVEWYLCMVVKETDIMASIQKTDMALQKNKKAIWRNFVWYFFIMTTISMLAIYHTTQIFISPIKSFIETTKKIAKGDLTYPLEINRFDEIGELSKSLNSMVDQLKISEETVALKTAQLKRLNEHLIHSTDNERKVISADLHDSIAQTLALTISKLKNMKESNMPVSLKDIGEIEGRLEQAVNEVRGMIYQLRPPVLDDFEIDIAMEYLIDGYNEKHNCQIEFINKRSYFLKTSQAIRLLLYRATNELIVNIIKHSKTRKARIEFSNTNEAVFIKVEDNGVGFDLNQVKQFNLNSFGLYSLSEQVESLGGSFEVFSKPDNGTRVLISTPLVSSWGYMKSC